MDDRFYITGAVLKHWKGGCLAPMRASPTYSNDEKGSIKNGVHNLEGCSHQESIRLSSSSYNPISRTKYLESGFGTPQDIMRGTEGAKIEKQ